MRVLMHQRPACFWDDPLGANQERYPASIADPKADQMRRELFKIAIGQIGNDPGETCERC